MKILGTIISVYHFLDPSNYSNSISFIIFKKGAIFGDEQGGIIANIPNPFTLNPQYDLNDYSYIYFH